MKVFVMLLHVQIKPITPPVSQCNQDDISHLSGVGPGYPASYVCAVLMQVIS